MKHIVIPNGPKRRLPFYLAMEEWVARRLPPDDYFFTWIVEPTVIVGRNQDLEKEVNLEYCRKNGIDVARRRSGGGCVFADLRNIMISYITPSTEVQTTFAYFTGRVAEQLRSMGLNATVGGRNDIDIDGRKISGNAFYHLPGRSIVHGTMLYHTDMTHMANAITPSRAKLESKGVKSVQSHIVCASELLPDMSLGEFHRRLCEGMTDDTIVLSAAQIAEIEAIEQNYYRPEWLFGLKPQASSLKALEKRRRIEGVGDIACTIALDADNRIDTIDIKGDFFMLADLDEAIVSHLRGLPLDREKITEALREADVAHAIVGLDAATLADIIAQ